MDCGGLYVIVSGTQERLLLLVDNLDMMGVSNLYTVMCLPHNIFYYSASYALRSFPDPYKLQFHWNNFHCDGNESMLSECSLKRPEGLTTFHCFNGNQEAGVICSSKLLDHHIMIIYCLFH